MRSRLALGGVALAVLAGMAMPATAAPLAPGAPNRTPDRQQVDLHGQTKLKNAPLGLQRDRQVSALVQLDRDPVAVQQVSARSFDRARARRDVRRDQSAVLPRLRSAGATVYGQLDTVLNAIQVRATVSDLDAIAALPGVKAVQVSRIVSLDNARSEQFTSVDRTWQEVKYAGRGQLIGIIDTGIDYTHADFGGAGTVAAYQGNDGSVVEPGSFPTAKVVAGYDFVGDDYDPGSASAANQVPRPDADPLDCEGHGSHVAGTAAGAGVNPNGTTYQGAYNEATLRRSFDVEPGVAPQARLAAYRVFGCEGSVTDDVVAAAIDRAVSDGVDVINMSLGSSYGSRNDFGTLAVDAATEAGVLVVTSAGNSGPGAYLVGSASTADSALSVAAVDAEFSRFPAVTVSGAVRGSGLVANEVTVPTPVTGEVVDLGLGCTASAYAAAAGKIALTTRGGGCPRTDRATFGQQAGALAVLMVNNTDALPPLEGPIPGVSIPFIGVAGSAAGAFTAAAGKVVTLTGGTEITNPGYARVADFSSGGPRRGDNAQKPDVAAPGVAIPSVAVGTGTGSARLSGTSMSAPHTAGVAALVRQAHPTWSPLQAKAAIMSTSSPTAIKDFDSQLSGTGLVQPRRATVSQAYAWTSTGRNSLAFGLNELTGAYRETQTFRITNRSTRSISYDMSSDLSSAPQGADVTISPKVVTVKAGATATVAVTISLSATDVARLPGSAASDGGELNSLHGLVFARPRSPKAGIMTLRMAFMSVPVPLSSVAASPTVKSSPSGALSGIKVTNSGVHTGTADVYQWLLADPIGDVADPEAPDLTNVGVQSLLPSPGSSDRLLVFAVSQARGTSTHGTREVDLALDTDGDGEANYYTVIADAGAVLTGSPDGTVAAITVDPDLNIVDAWPASAPANGSTVLAPVLASSLGVRASSPAIAVTAEGYSALGGGAVDAVAGPGRYNAFVPALSQGDFVSLAPGRSATIPTRVNAAQIGQQTTSGWLVISPDDKAGVAEADRVRLTLPASSAAQGRKPLLVTTR